MRHCTQCGGGIAETASFCRHCGAGVGARRQPLGRPPAAPAHPAPAALAAAGQAPPPSAFQNLSKAQAMRLTVKAGAKGLAKSLAVGVAALAPGFALLLLDQRLIGMGLLFLGAFGLMAWSYRKPWHLGWVSCLAPSIAAAATFAIKLDMFGPAAPPGAWAAGAIAAGALFGLLRGRSHTVETVEGVAFADPTLRYLILWVGATGLTVIVALATSLILPIIIAVLAAAFMTGTLATLSVALLVRSGLARRAIRTGAARLALLAVAATLPSAELRFGWGSSGTRA